MSVRHDRPALLLRYLRIPRLSHQGTPALFAELPGPAGAPALLLYGHYDVQPTGDLARWRWEGVPCDPFEPACFRDGRRVDPATLDAVRAGRQRWRVKIILDGEEEHGSPHLEVIARAHRARLAADVLIGSDGPKQ